MNKETREYDLLQHIKFCLECKNESQAIRMIEQYGHYKQEESYTEEEVLDLLVARNIEFNLYEGRDKVEEWFEQFRK
jgi:predicted DNA binding protein